MVGRKLAREKVLIAFFTLILTGIAFASENEKNIKVREIIEILENTPIKGNINVTVSSSPEQNTPARPENETSQASVSQNTATPTSDSGGEGFPKTGKVRVSGATLRIRSSPWGETVGEFPDGATITVLGEKDNWYRIEYNGKEAFVHKSYVDLGTGKIEAKIGYVKEKTEVFAGPNGDVIASIPAGTRIEEVLTLKDGWYEIKYNGRQAFVREEAISNLQ